MNNVQNNHGSIETGYPTELNTEKQKAGLCEQKYIHHGKTAL